MCFSPDHQWKSVLQVKIKGKLNFRLRHKLVYACKQPRAVNNNRKGGGGGGVIYSVHSVCHWPQHIYHSCHRSMFQIMFASNQKRERDEIISGKMNSVNACIKSVRQF